MSLYTRALSLFKKDARGSYPAVAVPPSNGSWQRVFDWFPGAFQQDVQIREEMVLSNWAVFACITLIANDIGKLRLKLAENIDGVWSETTSAALGQVIKKPNGFQTRQQFIENWIMSVLGHGNAYVLKEPDNRGVSVNLYVLDPCRVVPLITESGDVYYRLGWDYLAGIHDSDLVVPADQIIHHRINCLFHPLVGLSPVFACGLAATQGLNIQKNSAKFFANMSMPGGVLSSPQPLKEEQAREYKKLWEESYGGNNVGRIAVLGGGLEYKGIMQTAVDSQMTQMLQLTAEMVCATFHVPPFKIGVGEIPRGQKVSDLNQLYYNDCLQHLMHAIENLLDEGLGLDTPKNGTQYGTMFELDDILMMDQGTLTDVLAKQVGGGITKLDEARLRLNMPALPIGGDTAYLQQQNYSVEALAKRDAQDDPFASSQPSPQGPDPASTPAIPTQDNSKHFADLSESLKKWTDAQTLQIQEHLTASQTREAELTAKLAEIAQLQQKQAQETAEREAEISARFEKMAEELKARNVEVDVKHEAAQLLQKEAEVKLLRTAVITKLRAAANG